LRIGVEPGVRRVLLEAPRRLAADGRAAALAEAGFVGILETSLLVLFVIQVRYSRPCRQRHHQGGDFPIRHPEDFSGATSAAS
jgi:hypothetical protein